MIPPFSKGEFFTCHFDPGESRQSLKREGPIAKIFVCQQETKR